VLLGDEAFYPRRDALIAHGLILVARWPAIRHVMHIPTNRR
jgi:hypothetical protein